jgi:hypothetical protein
MTRWLWFLLIPGLAWGAEIDSKQSGNFSDTATWDGSVVPGKSDIANVTGGFTVTLDTGITGGTATDTVVDILHVDKGAKVLFDSTQSVTFSCNALWGSGCSGVAGDSTQGGSFWMFENDTLWITNANKCGGDVNESKQDIYFSGSSASIRIEGDDASNRAVIIGRPQTNAPDRGDRYPSWWGWSGIQVPATLSIKWAKFVTMGEHDDVANHGLQFDKDVSAGFTFEYVILDSVDVNFTGVQGVTFRGCTTYVYEGDQLSWRMNGADTCIWKQCAWIVDQGNINAGNTGGALDLLNTTECVVDSCLFRGINIYVAGSPPRGPIEAVNLSGATTCDIMRSRIDSFMIPFDWGTWNTSRVMYCTLSNTGQIVFDHSGWVSGGDGMRFAGNYIYGTCGYAIDVLTLYGTAAQSGDSLDFAFVNNTVVTFDSSTAVGFREVASAGYERRGISIVGNILCEGTGTGYDLELEDSIDVILDDWSSNAFTSRLIGDSASIDSTTNAPAGSNTLDSTYAFVDSANGDFTLYTDSDMMGALATAADTAWCDSFYTSPNYNIGAYQGAGQNRFNLPIGPNTVIWPVVIGTGRAE